MRKHLALVFVGGLSGVLAPPLSAPVEAATVNWTDWTPPYTTGSTSGTASGTTSDGVSVTYIGNVIFTGNVPGFVWLPGSTFSGGTVSNAPPTANGEISLTGGPGTGTETITFSQAVTNPVLAIASLGSGGIVAEFVFSSAEPFTIESGGASDNFGGSSIYSCAADTVCGEEGSGTVQFAGTYTSLTFTNPLFENYYLLTVGEEGLATAAPAPEPASLTLLGSALAGLGWFSRRRRKSA